MDFSPRHRYFAPHEPPSVSVDDLAFMLKQVGPPTPRLNALAASTELRQLLAARSALRRQGDEPLGGSWVRLESTDFLPPDVLGILFNRLPNGQPDLAGAVVVKP